MRRWRLPLRLIWPAGLVVLVVVLGALQYRWLGQVSEAERERMQASLRLRADQFTEDFDREISRIYTTFQTDGSALLAGDARAFAARYDMWRETTQAPGLVRHIYLFDAIAPATLREYQPATRTLVAAEWPATLKAVHDDDIRPTRVAPADISSANGGSAAFAGPVLASIPALKISLPTVTPLIFFGAAPSHSAAVLIVELDRDYLQSTFLPALADRYFTERGIDSYRFAVIDTRDNSRTIFARGTTDALSVQQHADATATLMSVRTDLLPASLSKTFMFSTSNAGVGSAVEFNIPGQDLAAVTAPTRTGGSLNRAEALMRPPGSGAPTSQFGVVIEQSVTSAMGDAVRAKVRAFSQAAPAWQLVLQHSSGSLEAAVNGARHRNLGLSFGMLALLAISVGLVIGNAERSRRLASQQMDFVATVSHELRTPLSVIRSAAQNLSAGIVHDATQAKKYGDLIDAEGRRLTDMVEQILEFAGLSNSRRSLNPQPVDMGMLVKDIAASCEPLLQAAQVTMELHVDDGAPIVAMVDEGAMRRAIQNLISNALKYGTRGGWIGLTVRSASARGREVQVDVSDRGPGIDAADLPHIFEPFYRGQRAMDGQIHGNGLGLGLVKRIVESHDGRVSVRSTPGEGATFTLSLLPAPPDALADPLPAPHDGQTV